MADGDAEAINAMLHKSFKIAEQQKKWALRPQNRNRAIEVMQGIKDLSDDFRGEFDEELDYEFEEFFNISAEDIT